MSDKKHKIPVRLASPDTMSEQITVSAVKTPNPKTSIPPKTAPELPAALKKQVPLLQTKPLATALPKPAPIIAKEQHSVTPIENASDAESGSPDTLPLSRLDDAVSDAAVDEIAAQEGDDLLMAEDSANSNAAEKLPRPSKHHTFFKRKLTWVIILILVIVGVVLGIPTTCYKLLGLVFHETYQVDVIDATTQLPVSDATLVLDGKTHTTDEHGQVRFSVPVGYGTLAISKLYYTTDTSRVLVGLYHQKTPLTLHLVATGRQVPLRITDKVSGQPIDGVEIAVLKTSTKTTSSGTATIVLPTKESGYQATISAPGYNTLQTVVTVTNHLITGNEFTLTPTGRVYFLSQDAGTINVDATNLDGTARQTVLAGTGYESSANTFLFHSSDWKYLMLLAQRSPSPATNELYLINTQSSNALTTIQEGSNSFTPIGWSGHYFLYEVQDLGVPVYQTGEYVLKSYDADTGHLAVLDQSNAAGAASNYASQTIGTPYILNGNLIYTKLWSGDSSLYSGSNYFSSIDSIELDGQDQVPLQQFTMNASSGSNIASITSVLYGANELYFNATTNNGTSQFYSYSGGSLSSASITPAQFSAVSYTPGVVSPSGSTAIFATTQNGKLSLASGVPDANPASLKPIATLSDDYTFVGWYSDNYLLLTYKNEALYVIAASGLAQGAQPQKITDILG